MAPFFGVFFFSFSFLFYFLIAFFCNKYLKFERNCKHLVRVHPQLISIKHVFLHWGDQIVHFFEMAPFFRVGEERELGVLEFDEEALFVLVGNSEREFEEARGTVGGVDRVGGCSVQPQFSCNHLCKINKMHNSISGKILPKKAN